MPNCCMRRSTMFHVDISVRFLAISNILEGGGGRLRKRLIWSSAGEYGIWWTWTYVLAWMFVGFLCLLICCRWNNQCLIATSFFSNSNRATNDTVMNHLLLNTEPDIPVSHIKLWMTAPTLSGNQTMIITRNEIAPFGKGMGAASAVNTTAKIRR